MQLIDDYRKGWALRYLREAKAEFCAAQKMPYMASSLILEAVKKAQVAVYHSLGDSASVEAIVRQAIIKQQSLEEPVLRFLVEIEGMIQQIAVAADLEREKAFEQADELIQLVSEIVELFVDEKVD
jgi:alcohol dehydrogenase class IV